jgi:hypothetical protein
MTLIRLFDSQVLARIVLTLSLALMAAIVAGLVSI